MPLSDVRVVDMSRLVAGNTLTQMLADFGADVIKVEPVAGDTLRAWKVQGSRNQLEDLRAVASGACASTFATRGPGAFWLDLGGIRRRAG